MSAKHPHAICPACRAVLPASSAIDARWQEGPPAVWTYLHFCSCHSVSRQNWEEGTRKAPRGAVEFSAAAVIRCVERLQTAIREGRMREELARLRADREQRVLLRTPEVFDCVRQLVRDRVRVAEPLHVRMIPDHDLHSSGVQRQILRSGEGTGAKSEIRTLRPGSTPAPLESRRDVEVIFWIDPGTELSLVSIEQTLLVLEADAWRPNQLLAWPDQVEPV